MSGRKGDMSRFATRNKSREWRVKCQQMELYPSLFCSLTHTNTIFVSPFTFTPNHWYSWQLWVKGNQMFHPSPCLHLMSPLSECRGAMYSARSNSAWQLFSLSFTLHYHRICIFVSPFTFTPNHWYSWQLEVKGNQMFHPSPSFHLISPLSECRGAMYSARSNSAWQLNSLLFTLYTWSRSDPDVGDPGGVGVYVNRGESPGGASPRQATTPQSPPRRGGFVYLSPLSHWISECYRWKMAKMQEKLSSTAIFHLYCIDSVCVIGET
jgi:hypothetical protein